jgi:hypothetical protein
VAVTGAPGRWIPPVTTAVEVFGLRLVSGAPVGRLVRAALDGDPDEIAADAVGLRGSVLDGVAVLHSTSWRWRPDVGLVLTYLCAPDPHTGPAPVVEPAHGHPRDGAGPSRPGEGDPAVAHVLHHGIDHLAWLADHHPGLVVDSRGAAPELWAAILRAGRHRAGRLIVPDQPA